MGIDDIVLMYRLLGATWRLFLGPRVTHDNIGKYLDRPLVSGQSSAWTKEPKEPFDGFSFERIVQVLQDRVINPMLKEPWTPDVVLASGRGGAFCGAIVASSLRTPPLRFAAVDTVYLRTVDGQGVIKYAHVTGIRMVDALSWQKVLIIESARTTGNVSTEIVGRLIRLNPRVQIRDFVLAWSPGSPQDATRRPVYYGFKIPGMAFLNQKFPWHVKKDADKAEQPPERDR